MKNRMFMATQSGLKIFERIKDFWEERDHVLTGLDITAVDLNGDKGILGTTEGVYISKDGGENWMLDSKGIDTPHVRWVRIHPHDPRYTFVGTEPANIYSKMEDDDQWQKSERVSQLRDQNDWFMPYSPNPGCVRGFAFHKQHIFASVEVGGLLYSNDYGATWDLVQGSTGKPHQEPLAGQIHPDVHSVQTHPSSPEYVLAPTGGGFFISQDGGLTWEQKYDCYCRAVWVDPTNGLQIVLGPADGVSRGGRIERSIDGGKTWQPIMENLEEKWQDVMVERFISADEEIYAVLSDGKVLTAEIGEFSWQYLMPALARVRMIALI
mgnify:CR=1 FL=1